MKTIFKLLIVLVICLIGIGIYRGWFSFSSTSSDTEKDKINVGVSVDKSKMREDVSTAREKIRNKVKGIAEEVKEKKGSEIDSLQNLPLQGSRLCSATEQNSLMLRHHRLLFGYLFVRRLSSLEQFPPKSQMKKAREKMARTIPASTHKKTSPGVMQKASIVPTKKPSTVTTACSM